MKKHPLQSKMLWTNMVAAVASIGGVLTIDLGLDPATQAQIVTGILAVVNIVLRFFTREPIV